MTSPLPSLPHSGAEARAFGSRPAWITFVLALAIALAIHRRALSASFFSDDYLFLEQARSGSLLSVLSGPDPIGNYFRPVSRQLWFWSITHLFGPSPVAFHLANLVLLAGILGVFFALVRALIGLPGAFFACIFVALTTSFDVPMLWASGSQDLLAVFGAIGAILLMSRNHRFLAAIVFLASMLSKETVVLTPLIATMVCWNSEKDVRLALRRCWPLYAVFVVGAAAWTAAALHSRIQRTSLLPEPSAVGASLLHVLQTALGLESLRWSTLWPTRLPPLFVPALATLTLLVASRVSSASVSSQALTNRENRSYVMVGALWALCGALPIALVVSTWSAYYYLFSMFGVGFLIGAVSVRRQWLAGALILFVALLGANTRELRASAARPDRWSPLSHLNAYYISRGSTLSRRLLGDLRSSRPTLQTKSTLFFSGIPALAGFQIGDGALVRWAYGDTTLRAYYMGAFNLQQVRRGPVAFFQGGSGHLEEVIGPDSLERIGLGLVLSESFGAARDIHLLAWRQAGNDAEAFAYRLAWLEAVHGQLDSTRMWLTRSGVQPQQGSEADLMHALRAASAVKHPQAIILLKDAVARHVMDPRGHAVLAAFLARDPAYFDGAVFEALAARALDPNNPAVWRRWAILQAMAGRPEQARENLQRYLALGGDSARQDIEVLGLLKRLNPAPSIVGETSVP